MIQGFKEFILKGNIIDLAIAVVIGGAFATIVTKVVEGFVSPLIGIFLPSGSLSSFFITVPNLYGGEANFAIGSIISGVISFLAVALVIYFFVIVPMKKVQERRAAKEAAGEAEATPTEQELLAEIRDLLAKK